MSVNTLSKILLAFLLKFNAPAFAKEHQANTAAAPELVPSGLKRIARISGKSPSTDTFPNSGGTQKYNVGGTDLGIMWEMGNGQTGIFFGDTYGNDFKPGQGGPGDARHWRSNVLAFSSDTDLSDGLTIDSMATSADSAQFARQIIPKLRGSHTAIPTSAIHVNGVDYVHYFNLQRWEGWEINFSSLYKSEDNGKSWERCPEVVFPRSSKFSIVAYAKKDGFVYMIGSPSLRHSAPYLCRFPAEDILKQDQYEYWNNQSGWIKNNEGAATEIFQAPVGEGSLVYSEYHRCWLFIYLNENTRSIEMRNAKEVTGAWSEPEKVVSASDYPGLYAPFFYPHIKDEAVYFTMSMWQPYNVFLMRINLAIK